jgi:hypothetical protein
VPHLPEDLTRTEEGPICRPCLDAWFPPCPQCGRRVELPEGREPGDGPFLCDECREGS